MLLLLHTVSVGLAATVSAGHPAVRLCLSLDGVQCSPRRGNIACHAILLCTMHTQWCTPFNPSSGDRSLFDPCSQSRETQGERSRPVDLVSWSTHGRLAPAVGEQRKADQHSAICRVQHPLVPALGQQTRTLLPVGPGQHQGLQGRRRRFARIGS